MKIDEAADLLKDPMFFIAMNGENGRGIELRYRAGQLDLISIFAAVADAILTDYIPENGYDIRRDLRAILDKVIQLNKTEYKYQDLIDNLNKFLSSK